LIQILEIHISLRKQIYCSDRLKSTSGIMKLTVVVIANVLVLNGRVAACQIVLSFACLVHKIYPIISISSRRKHNLHQTTHTLDLPKT